MEFKVPTPSTESRFRTPHEELAYLKARVEEKERELGLQENAFERERIVKRELQTYADTPPAAVLHESVVVPDHDAMRDALHLKKEEHDGQIDGLLKIVAEKGVRNALSVVSKMYNPHLEDDFHRVLIQYVKKNLPIRGIGEKSSLFHALRMTLFEVTLSLDPKEDKKSFKELLSAMEQVYAGVLPHRIGEQDRWLSFEIAVSNEGREGAYSDSEKF
jgi:hypothetical protein